MRNHSELTIRKQDEFNRVYRHGRSKGSRFVVVIYNRNGLDYTRAAFVASKKVGNSVIRNRARRLMRPAYHNIKERIMPGYDIVFVARNTIVDASEIDVEKAMFGAVRAAGLFKTDAVHK